MLKLIDKDFAKYKAQGIHEKMMKAVLEIATYRKTVGLKIFKKLIQKTVGLLDDSKF